MRLLSEGCWSVRSESDPRWNGDGRGEVGGFVAPPEAEAFIARKKQELGEEPPADLTFDYMKD